eukprot:g475.t1
MTQNSSDRRLASLARHFAASTVTNRKVVLRQNPDGEPTNADFEIVIESLPPLQDGQTLLKTKWLTLDPYMRGLNATGFMNNPGNIGKTIIGGTVSEVLESRSAKWAVGDLVVGYYGWQEYSIGNEDDVQWNNKKLPNEKWSSDLGPPSLALGTLGMTGYTAYQGVFDVGKAQSGETVVVSAASGAVGQVVGQLAKIIGCRVVGIAGGPAKCAYCVDDLGFDACIDYKAGNLPAELADACPNGIDFYFENVGGDVLEAVIPLLNKGCRVPVCGWVSQYNNPNNNKPKAKQVDTPLVRLAQVGLGDLAEQESFAFRMFNFMELQARQPEATNALKAMSDWIKEGKLKYSESITDGIESCADAFIGMLNGKNFGKTMVRMSA